MTGSDRTYVALLYAHNTAGVSPAAQSVYTLAGPPGVPRNAVATAANASATVRWSPPTNTGGVGLDFYLVAAYDGTGTQRSYMTVAATSTFTTYTPGIPNGAASYFGVFAHNPSAATATRWRRPRAPTPRARRATSTTASTG